MRLPNGDMLLYHVTEKSNLESIERNGLIPKIGPRSKHCSEQEPTIYLFHKKTDMEQAVMTWLGEQFPDDTELACVIIKMPKEKAMMLKYDINVNYEVTYNEVIPPEWFQKYVDVNGEWEEP